MPHIDDRIAPPSQRRSARRVARRLAFHGVSWFILLPALLVVVLYLTLLITPIRVPFVAEGLRGIATDSIGEEMDVELGATYLALEKGAPVIRFAPVTLTNKGTGGTVELEAIEVGFSLVDAFRGQPGVVISMLKPRLQIVQDLLGPRLARFEVIESDEGDLPTLRVWTGDQQLPSVGITREGLDVRETSDEIPTVEFRSDHDWMVLNLLAGERGLQEVSKNAKAGVFSRLIIRDAELDMADSVYGLVRTFENMNFEMEADSVSGRVTGKFTVDIAGETMQGEVEHFVGDDGIVRMDSKLTNANFSAVVPFMDDPDAMTAVRGLGAVDSTIYFQRTDGTTRLLGGEFTTDLSGMSLRLQDDYYPIHSGEFYTEWDASKAQLRIHESEIRIGESRGLVSGVLVMGLDPAFGPTMRMSMTGRDVHIHPYDMGPPEETIDEVTFVGWQAPLYSTMGIEQTVLKRGDMEMVATGRGEFLASGPGFEMDVTLRNATADDLKRFWPYLFGTDARNWFLENIEGGRVTQGQVRFDFPPGSMPEPGQDWRWPEDSMIIDLEAEDVSLSLLEGMEPIFVAGTSHLTMHDADLNIRFGDMVIRTGSGDINVSDAGFGWGEIGLADHSVFVVDGMVEAPLEALVELAETSVPDRLADVSLPISLDAISGYLRTNVDAALTLKGDEYALVDADYDITGRVNAFALNERFMDRTINEGQFDFEVTDEGYSLEGPTSIDGIEARLDIGGTLEPDATPDIELSAVFSPNDLATFGFDASQFFGGSVRLSGSPKTDGSFDVALDLTNANLTIADLAINKRVGVPGQATASLTMDGDRIDVKDIDLAFGEVQLNGDVEFSNSDGLVSADFSTFRLSADDDARVAVRPDGDGIAVTIRGSQLDLKPLLGRFFSLEGGSSGGPAVNAFDQAITIDAEIERALGFYSTPAFNLDLDLTLKGADLRNASLLAQFEQGRGVSVTTNPLQSGKVVSVAFNDLGQILRFAGVYPQMVGGTGSLVMTTRPEEGADYGQVNIQNFSIVNEANVAQVLSTHSDSRSLIARQNRLDIESGEVSFIRYPDRMQITNAVVDGGRIGGTARGTIYTEAGRYDLTGTYIPLFGLNNAFQQLPVLGRLLGGRDGEGLIGVTFAVRGPLNEPQFLVNPASILAPGAFRGLFEFRTQQPAAASN